MRKNKKRKIKCWIFCNVWANILPHRTKQVEIKRIKRAKGKTKKLKTTNSFLRLYRGVANSTRCRRLTCNTRKNKTNQLNTRANNTPIQCFTLHLRKEQKKNYFLLLFSNTKQFSCRWCDHFKPTMAIHIFNGTIYIWFNSIPLSQQSTCRVGLCFFCLSANSIFHLTPLWLVIIIYICLYNGQYDIQTRLIQPSSSVNSKFSSHFNESNYSLFKFCSLQFFFIVVVYVMERNIVSYIR